MNAPAIVSANQIGELSLGQNHRILFLDNIHSAGSVRYAFILAIYDTAQKPVYFLASEVNQMATSFGGGSHFFGVFDGEVHANLGASDDWGDPHKFFPQAVRTAAKRFGVEVGGRPNTRCACCWRWSVPSHRVSAIRKISYLPISPWSLSSKPPARDDWFGPHPRRASFSRPAAGCRRDSIRGGKSGSRLATSDVCTR